MADVIRLSAGATVHVSIAASSSSSYPLLFTTLASTLNSRQPSSPPNLSLHRKICPSSLSLSSSSSVSGLSRLPLTSRSQLLSFKVNATVNETNKPKWWEKNAGPNMIDIHSTQEFLSALCEAGDRLVIVEFYGTWCASCRALFPKLCRTAQEHPEIIFLKVNFDENKPMCKSLGVRVLPYFHFYRGAHGQLESFSCSLAKFQKIKDAIEMHSQTHCNVGPPKELGELNLESVSAPIEKTAAAI